MRTLSKLNQLESEQEIAYSSDWWGSRSQEQKREYLKRHPNSKFHPKNRVKDISPVAKPKPKKAAPAPAPVKAAGNKEEHKAKAKDVKKNWSTDDGVKKTDEALKDPQKWGKRKVSRAARAVRDALREPSGKSFLKATAKVLAIAGASVVLGGAGLALGVDTGVFVPALMQRAWKGMKDQKNDLALVSEITKRMRERLADPSEDELADSLHTKKK